MEPSTHARSADGRATRQGTGRRRVGRGGEDADTADHGKTSPEIAAHTLTKLVVAVHLIRWNLTIVTSITAFSFVSVGWHSIGLDTAGRAYSWGKPVTCLV